MWVPHIFIIFAPPFPTPSFVSPQPSVILMPLSMILYICTYIMSLSNYICIHIMSLFIIIYAYMYERATETHYCCPYVLGCGVGHLGTGVLSGGLSLRKTASSPWAALSCLISSTRGGPLWLSFSFSHLWLQCGLVGFSWVHHHCYIRKTLFYVCPPGPGAL